MERKLERFLFFWSFVIGALGIYELILAAPAYIALLNFNLDNRSIVPWVLMGLLIISWIILMSLLAKVKLTLFQVLLLGISLVGLGLNIYTDYILPPNSDVLIGLISKLLVSISMINMMVYFMDINARKIKPDARNFGIEK